MSQFSNNQNPQQQNPFANPNNRGAYQPLSFLNKSRKKTGPSPKYGPNQAKKMVSMRLSPDALGAIKRAAEVVFRDSQADVVEKLTRLFPPEALQKIYIMAQEFNMKPEELIEEALENFKQKKQNEVTTA